MAVITRGFPVTLLLIVVGLICAETVHSYPQQNPNPAIFPRDQPPGPSIPQEDASTAETAVVRQIALRGSNIIPSHSKQLVKIANLTRQQDGDEFQAHGVNTCSNDVCIGLSNETAALSTAAKNSNSGYRGSAINLPSTKNACKCQCLSHSPTFREDLGVCVDDIDECTLAPFVSGSVVENIPFVFLPQKEQFIHPSRDIIFPGAHTSVCAVTGYQFLTKAGWAGRSELGNSIDSLVPFSVTRDKDRTFIRWKGTPEQRELLEGRLVLVHLSCRDAAPLVDTVSTTASHADSGDRRAPRSGIAADKQSETGSAATSTTATVKATVKTSSRRRTARQVAEKQHDQQQQQQQQRVFTPCIAFRVAGTPMKYVPNVAEVVFQPGPSNTLSSDGLTTREYIVIAICSLLLGLIYVASALLYLHMKKKKRGPSGSGNGGDSNTLDSNAKSRDGADGGEGAYKNDQVAFGQGFMRSGGGSGTGSSIYGSKTGSLIAGRHGGSLRSMSASTPREEMGIVKSNPLLKHFPNLHDSSDIEMNNSSNNERDDDDLSPGGGGGGAGEQSMMMMLGQRSGDGSNSDELDGKDGGGNSSGPEDCLPEENVSIVDEMTNEDKLESMKAIVNGTIRRKLYFNPAYFEPDLLVSPPPAAIEFLNKIREVITIAKYKMATKRYQPSLIDIQEELQNSNASELYGRTGASISALSRKSSVASRATSKNKNKDCAGCPGCEEDNKVQATTEALESSPPLGHAEEPSSQVLTNSSSTQPPPAESNCKNCGDKRNSIRKWLEGVSTGIGTDAENSDAEKSDGTPERLVEVEHPALTQTNSDTSSSSDSDTIKANSVKSRSLKGKAPPIPLTIPPPPSVTSNSSNLRRDQMSTVEQATTGPKIVNASKKAPLTTSLPKPARPGAIAGSGGRPAWSPPHPKTPPPPPPQHAPPKQPLVSKQSTVPQNHMRQPPPQPPPAAAIVEGLYVSRGSNEIYNNPRFRLGSPELPPRSQHAPQKTNSQKRASKRMEVSDQYSNTNHYNLFRNMPDMVYEALANDLNLRNLTQTNSPYGSLKLPTPDYNDEDSSFYEQYKFARNSAESPYVPTPDYNTYGRTKKAGYQPDSPIYTRKSPHYLIVDYETDSLERGASKAKTNLSSGSDVSSHPSPSLSAALPLEEEVEIGNAVYDQVEGFRKEPDNRSSQLRRHNSNGSSYSMVSEVYVPNNGSGLSRTGSKIKYNVPHAGSMTIELDHHPPSEYEMSTDSEQFEPDTLDRKQQKNGRGPTKQVNTWNERFIQANSFLYGNDEEDHILHSQLSGGGGDHNMNSLPDMNFLNEQRDRLVLRSSGSFKKDGLSRFNENAQHFLSSRTGQKAFGSLREIYEAKNMKGSNGRPSVQQIDFAETIAGRILSLEEKHAKRQRQISEESLMRQKKRIPPPDVVPIGGGGGNNAATSPNALYDYPKRSNSLLMAKNLTVWNTRNESANNDNENKQSRYPRTVGGGRTSSGTGLNHDTDTCDTISTNSDATDFTGVSETNANSEFEIDVLNNNKKVGGKGRLGSSSPHDYIRAKDGCYINELEGKSPQTLGILESFMSLGEINNRHFPLTGSGDHVKEGCALDDSDSSRPSTIKSRRSSPLPATIGSHLTSPRVFRVEVNTNTNGMQIALGLLEKKKKSKDLKGALKKFVNKATARFSGGLGGGTKLESTQDVKTDDEGVSSILGERQEGGESGGGVSMISGVSGRAETDCGYISADSSESKIYGRKFYDRFNFKQVAEKLNEGSYIDLDVVEEREVSGDDEEEEGSGAKELIGVRGVMGERDGIKDNGNGEEEDDDDESTLKDESDPEDIDDFYNYIEMDQKQDHVTVVQGRLTKMCGVADVESEIVCTGEHSIIEIKGNSPPTTLHHESGGGGSGGNARSHYEQSLAQLEYDTELLALETDDGDGGGVSSGLSSDESSEDDDDVCESGAESIETNSVFFKQMRKF